jgi:3'(2'), 5'-bisphosphate nucleotidase
MTYDREIAAARDAAREAALLCEDVRREMVGTHLTKEDRSPVTVADFGAQAVICRRLEDAFTDDPVVGEEDAGALRAPDGASTLERVTEFVGHRVPGATADDVVRWIDHGNGRVGERFWTLDPIDGTKGFLRGDQYAIALALIVDGDLKAGVLACPYLPVDAARPDGERGALITAVRGEGAFLETLAGGDPRPIRVVAGENSPDFRMVESVEAAHGHHSLQERIAKNVGFRTEPVRMDSQAKYAAVARGQAALYLRLPSPKSPDYRENVWDHAAGALVVEEAGGTVTDVFGNALRFADGPRMVDNRGVVVSNGTIHDRVMGELAAVFR